MGNKRIIYGFHAINARLWQNPESLIELYIQQDKTDARTQEILTKAEQENIRVHFVEQERLNTLSGQKRHQGILGFIDATKNHFYLEDILENLTAPPIFLILDGITDPHNLGACLRVADAMGVDAVIAPKNKSAGLSATVSKVACGAAEVIPFVTVTNLARTIRQLQEQNITIIGTDMEATQDLFQFDIGSQGIAWVMGSEGDGMRRLTKEHCDVLVRIPMFGTVESMNVSVSTGMVLYETQRQRKTSS